MILINISLVIVSVSYSQTLYSGDKNMDKKNKTEKEWQSCLSPIEYNILRGKGETLLFSSDTKYNSGSGWPSFWEPIDSSAITEHKDSSLFMTRTEIQCSNCGGHLGHVFDDGPQPTGLRYCVNSASLNFQKSSNKEK